MAKTNVPVIIKKVKGKGEHAHHGGAWKVAYADFVTAMMAFFLLLWLLNVTTDIQKRGIADYFEPTIASKSQSGAGGVMGGCLLSSAAHTVKASGSPTVAWNVVFIGRGPCWNGPFSLKPTNGGVLLLASTNGESSQSGSRLPGVDIACPLATRVHVSFSLPKLLGTVMVNMPHCRFGRKCVGCPRSGPPGSVRLSGP